MLRAATKRASGISSASIAASAAGWIGSLGWPDHQRGRLDLLATLADGAIRPKKMPWIAAAIGAGRWSRVSSAIPAQNGTMPRGTSFETRRSRRRRAA